MSALVQVFRHEQVAIKACGRACPSMHPLSLPELPAPPPISLAMILRTHPEIEIDLQWLQDMDTDATIH